MLKVTQIPFSAAGWGAGLCDPGGVCGAPGGAWEGPACGTGLCVLALVTVTTLGYFAVFSS